MSPVAQAYIDYVKKNKTNILKEKFSWIDEIPTMSITRDKKSKNNSR